MEPNNPVQQNPNQAPVAPEMKKSHGMLVSFVIVIILIIIGTLYIWGGNLMGTNNESAATSESITTTTSASNQAAAPKQNSDEVSAIESDLSASGSTEIDMSGLDNI